MGEAPPDGDQRRSAVKPLRVGPCARPRGATKAAPVWAIFTTAIRRPLRRFVLLADR